MGALGGPRLSSAAFVRCAAASVNLILWGLPLSRLALDQLSTLVSSSCHRSSATINAATAAISPSTKNEEEEAGEEDGQERGRGGPPGVEKKGEE